MRGFSGHLPLEQLLYLWDLILGYDSLEIIPLFAVTILSFRKENLLQVNTQQNVEVREKCDKFINVDICRERLYMGHYNTFICNVFFLSGCTSRLILVKSDAFATTSTSKRIISILYHARYINYIYN